MAGGKKGEGGAWGGEESSALQSTKKKKRTNSKELARAKRNAERGTRCGLRGVEAAAKKNVAEDGESTLLKKGKQKNRMFLMGENEKGKNAKGVSRKRRKARPNTPGKKTPLQKNRNEKSIHNLKD